MIEALNLSSAATFGTSPEVLPDLSKINLIYGANGTGETTISRAIADNSRFPGCRLVRKSGSALQTTVYNRGFIGDSFSESSELRGVFTLVEENVGLLKQIESGSWVRRRRRPVAGVASHPVAEPNAPPVSTSRPSSTRRSMDLSDSSRVGGQPPSGILEELLVDSPIQAQQTLKKH